MIGVAFKLGFGWTLGRVAAAMVCHMVDGLTDKIGPWARS